MDHPTTTFSAADDKVVAYTQALLRTLSYAKVSFIRYLALDVCNHTRCKAVPVKHLLQKSSSSSSSTTTTTTLDCQVAMAKVCFAGLPSFGDMMMPKETGLDAQDTVILMPDLCTLRVLPYSPKSALVLANLYEQQQTTGLYVLSDLCCRGLLQKIVQTAAQKHKIGVSVGAELEFCLYTANDDKPVDLSHFAYTRTLNQQEDFIDDVYKQIVQQDIEVEAIHAESAPGQLEIVLVYQINPVTMADYVLLARETVSNVARTHGLKAVFLPKLHPMAAGNGCHVHLSLYDIETKENLFASRQSLSRQRRQSCISPMGQSFMEGILQHMPALLALTIPTTNSFRRIGPGCWTGSQVTWAFEDKEASLRVVANLLTVEWKLCDSTANLYLALVGIISAGLDGIANKLELRPSRHDHQDSSSEGQQQQAVAPLPSTLEESLACLEKDKLLTKVLPSAMLKGYLALRRAEADRASKMSYVDEVKEALERA